MMKNRIFTIIFTSLATGLFASGQDSFDAVYSTILTNNPDLRSARIETEAQELQERSTLNLSDPEVEFSHKWGPKQAGNKTELTVSQGFDWPGVYRHRRSGVKHRESALNYLLESTIIDKRLEIKLLLIDLVYVNRQSELLGRKLKAIDSLLVTYSNPVNSTNLTKLDLNKLKIERYRLNSKFEASAIQKLSIKQKLEELNGNSIDESALKITKFPADSIRTIAVYEEISKRNPEYLAMQAQTSTAESLLKESRLMNLPGFSLGYSFAREEHNSFNGFAVGVSLPLFSNRNKVKSAKMQLEAQRIKEQQMHFDIETQIFAQLIQVQIMKKAVDSARNLLTEIDYERLLGLALGGGQISLGDYLIECNFYVQFEEEYLEAQYQYQCQLATLNKLL
ncbi:MAG: TolC family protein [Muribaculum sp.]|nr:TolC family protein [Muribaculaceae bacterium]MCM1080866.1 TolC family protein [Muribaculum sp.]